MVATEPTRSAAPLNERLFRLEESNGIRPVLLGSRCPECGQHFFPRRTICLACGHEGLGTAELSGTGTVWSYTIAHQVPPGAIVKAPYAIAQIELPESVLIGALLRNCEPDEVRIGMEVEIVPVVVGKDAQGRETVAFAYQPVRRPAAERE
jgi:uncharacterized OB-fold protein